MTRDGGVLGLSLTAFTLTLLIAAGAAASKGAPDPFLLGLGRERKDAQAEQDEGLEPEGHAHLSLPEGHHGHHYGHSSQEAANEHEHHDVHEHRFHIGAVTTGVATFVDRKTDPTMGGGLTFGWVAIANRLELEVAARVMYSEGGVELVQDVVVKFPFHATTRLHPFIELGPTVLEAFVAGETEDAPRRQGWGIGGTIEMGVDFWVTRRAAIYVEADYNIIYRSLTSEGLVQSGMVQEVGGNLGFLFGF